MKKRVLLGLSVITILSLFSCEKDKEVDVYSGSKIMVTVIETGSEEVAIIVTASDISDLGVFTIGVCYSEGDEPSVNGDHYEIEMDSRTLSEDDFEFFYIISYLKKSTDYSIKGYVKTGGDIYYSPKKTFRTKGNILTVYVDPVYITGNREMWFSLSDKGNTILVQKLANSGSYTFEENIPDTADVHLFRWDPGNKSLYVESYTRIVPDVFVFYNPYYSYSSGQATVTISDLNDFLGWGVAASWWWKSTTDQQIKSLTTWIYGNPDDLFIYYLPSSGEPPQYKVADDVAPSASLTYTMADFSPMTDYLNVPLPDNVFFTYTIAGFDVDYYTQYKKFHGYSYTSGYSGDFKLYYPKNVNSNYFIYTFYNTSSTQAFYNSLGPLPETVFTAFPSITIGSPGSFATTTSTVEGYTGYEVMDFCGKYYNGDIYIQWDYNKKPQAQNAVQAPEFPAEVLQRINNVSVNDLSFSDVGYFDLLSGNATTYDMYVKLIVKQSARFYDVVTGRRYYFQWVNKGTAGYGSDLMSRHGMPEEDIRGQ